MAEEIQQESTTPEQPQGETPKAIDPVEFAKMQAALKEANKEAATRRKQLEAYEKAEAERKAAEMTETEKLAAKLKEYETKLAQAERAALVRKVADEAGLPAQLAIRLQGDTEDELRADAEKLRELIPAEPAKPKLKIDPTNPGNAGRVETRAEKKARLMPSSVGVFDRGGGINWPDAP